MKMNHFRVDVRIHCLYSINYLDPSRVWSKCPVYHRVARPEFGRQILMYIIICFALVMVVASLIAWPGSEVRPRFAFKSIPNQLYFIKKGLGVPRKTHMNV